MNGSQFSIPLKCLRFIGFYHEKLLQNPRLLRFIAIVPFSFLISCFPGELYFITRNFNNVLAVAEASGPMFTFFTSAVKLVTFFFYQELFYQLIDQINNLSIKLNIKDSSIIRKINTFDRKMTLFYFVSAVATGIGFAFLPIIKNVIRVLVFGEDFDFNELPVKCAFPFKIDYSPVYELVYFVYIGGIYVAVFISIGVDCLIFGLCLNFCGHFDILKESFDGDKAKFVSKHQILLNLAEDLKKLVKPIVLVQFLVLSINLCVLAFQIVALESWSTKVITIPFLVSITIQLFIYSYGGQLIMEKSSKVADFFYQNDKDFVLIIARAQKAIIIEAGFYKATLSTFNAIMSSTASLIALLQSFLE